MAKNKKTRKKKKVAPKVKKKSVQSFVHPDKWDHKKLKTLLRRMKGRPVLVVGDVGVDRYTEGDVQRISPEAPVPIVRVQEERLKLGLAANVADNIRVLGGEPVLTGVIGKDRSAEDFRDLLNGSDIDSDFLVVDRSRRTALKERVVSESQQLLRVDYESQTPVSTQVQTQLLRKVKRGLGSVEAVILEDYGKGLFTPTLLKSIFALAKKAGKPTIVDPSARAGIELYRGATILTPNKKEAEALSRRVIHSGSTRSLKSAGEWLIDKTGAEHVILTLGKDGMAIFSRGRSNYRLIPTCAVEVYDVSGAGDTVVSVLALALSSGGNLEEAAILGNVAAGVEVSKRGTATVKPREILKRLEEISS